jgi:uncharacterized protein YciI
MYAEDGATPVGSMFILEADSLDHAKAISADDPYAKASLWERCDIRQFNWIVRQ